MPFQKEVLIDGKGHLLGRLASTICKEIQAGQKIVVVRCEEINISGSLFRNKLKYYAFLKKRMNTNPKKGPFHYRAPSRILWRVVRGMIAHKKSKGKAALARLKTFEGCPEEFNRKKKLCIPRALKNLRLKPGRKFCRLGDLSTLAGWRHNDLINKLEAKRMARNAAFYEKKKAMSKITEEARAATKDELKDIDAQLAELGYGEIKPNYKGKAEEEEKAADAGDDAGDDDDDDDDDDDGEKPAAKEGDAEGAEKKEKKASGASISIVAGYMLALIGGNEKPSAEDVTSILESVGGKPDEAHLKAFMKEVESKKIEDIIAAGSEKLGSMPSGGGGGAGGAGGAAAGEEKKEEKKEEEEDDGGIDFSDDDE